MVFQSLNIFKSKSEPVMAADASCLTPMIAGSEAMAEAASGVAQRGTAVALKDVANPSRDDIEADFAFISDILNRAGVAETTATAANPVGAPTEAAAMTPRVSSAPKHVPHHKRGASADKSKPRFAVQEGPRSATPEFLNADADEVLAPEQEAVQTVSPTEIYDSIVGGVDDEQMSLPLAEASPIEVAPVEAFAAPVARACVDEVDHASGAEVSEVDMERALAILDMRPSKPRALAQTAIVCFEARESAVGDAPAVASEIAPRRTSLFARRVKAAKASAAKNTPRRAAETGSANDVLVRGIEPPALVRKLMSALPTPEIPQGVSDFAKARLARDPFDRLMEEAHRA